MTHEKDSSSGAPPVGDQLPKSAAPITEDGKEDRLTAETPATSEHPTALRPMGFTVELNEEQSRFLRDMIGEDKEAYELALGVGDGHSGYGLYVWLAEYREEGCALLKNLEASSVLEGSESSTTAWVSSKESTPIAPERNTEKRLRDFISLWHSAVAIGGYMKPVMDAYYKLLDEGLLEPGASRANTVLGEEE